MNIKRLIVVSVASLAIALMFSAHTTQAQTTRVAIVDVGLIFKKHPQFAAQLEQLKGKADGFKAEAMQAQQALLKEAEVLKQYKVGSVDYKAGEAKLAQKSAGMEVDARDKMRNLMETEAQLHLETYQQVNALISKFCDENEIQLVLRYNSLEMDPNKPGTVMQRVNSSVVFHNPANDITSTIIAQLGGQTANSGLPDRR